MLEGGKYVTGGLVASSICYLRKLIVALVNHEDEAIAGAAKSMLQDFDQRWGAQHVLLVASFSAPEHIPALLCCSCIDYWWRRVHGLPSL